VSAAFLVFGMALLLEMLALQAATIAPVAEVSVGHQGNRPLDNRL
jgi:hypothetical protein